MSLNHNIHLMITLYHDTTLCDKVWQWFAAGHWFSSGTPVSPTKKTNCHDINEILLKVVLKHHNPNPKRLVMVKIKCFWNKTSLNKCTGIVQWIEKHIKNARPAITHTIIYACHSFLCSSLRDICIYCACVFSDI
jgi:hypothetical protein